MNSLRTKLLLWVCGSTIVVMIAAAGVLFVLARAYQIGQLDNRVHEKARLLTSTISLEGDAIELGFEELDLTEFQTSEGGWYLQVSVNNEPIYRSPSLGELGLDLDRSGEDTAAVGWFELPGPRRGRGVSLRLNLDKEPRTLPAEPGQGSSGDAAADQAKAEIFVFVARDAGEALAVLRHLAFGLTLVTGGAILVLAIVLIGVVNRSVRPVNELAAMIERIDATGLDSKIELATLPRELQPIVLQFNALMGRLGAAFERERGFCADITHELRTPLAGLRATLDVTAARQRSPQEYAQATGQCRRMVLETQNLVEALLQIAKFESGQIVVYPELTDVNARIQTVWQDAAHKTAGHKNYQLRCSLLADQPVWTDPAVLEIILGNLLANAREYVDDGGWIELKSATVRSDTIITIANSGSQVAAEDVGKAFDRFWRGGSSRTDTGSHFGLGLSLAQRAAKKLGGALSVDAELNGVFRVICHVPTGEKNRI